MTLRWLPPPELPAEAKRALAGFSRPMQHLLFNRGLTEADVARRFLDKSPDEAHDSALFHQMPAAVSILRRAIQQGRPVVVYGDYDADGVTGSALLVEALRQAGGQVDAYIPDRFEEGYGLNMAAVERLAAQGRQVLVTVDCGTRSVAEVARAKELGLEVILTDHHHPAAELPPADAILNPRLADETYPFNGLAGVGIAYKLAASLFGDSQAQSHLDLVALGTIADLAPLQDENRVLVWQGLNQINAAPRPGIRALIEAAGLQAGTIGAANVAFALGPRLNAAGRMDSAGLALTLLLARDPAQADELAVRLDRLNRDRQEETKHVVERARQIALERAERAHLMFALDPEFHEGVVGLAAARLMEEFYLPALVASERNGLIRGSARSVPGFHITEALEACDDLLLEYGGHAAAAGFRLQRSELEAFVARLADQVRQFIERAAPERSQQIDAELPLDELDVSLLDDLEQLEPFGQGNPPPVFAAYGARVLAWRPVGKQGDHLKLTLAGAWKSFDAIAFRKGQLPSLKNRPIDVIFHFERDWFRGVPKEQLNVIDLRPAGSG